MNLGDLIDWNGERWLVHKIERTTKSAIVIDRKGLKEVVAQDLDEANADACKVLGNPTSDWPFVTIPPKERCSRVESVIIPSLSGDRVLNAFDDWVRLDPFQIGGPLFLNPGLNLRIGDNVVVCFASKPRPIRINVRITGAFRSATERAARAAKEQMQAPRTVYDRLLGDDFDDDE